MDSISKFNLTCKKVYFGHLCISVFWRIIITLPYFFEHLIFTCFLKFSFFQGKFGFIFFALVNTRFNNFLCWFLSSFIFLLQLNKSSLSFFIKSFSIIILLRSNGCENKAERGMLVVMTVVVMVMMLLLLLLLQLLAPVVGDRNRVCRRRSQSSSFWSM